MSDTFSARYGIKEAEVPIVTYNEAPVQIRNIIWNLALKSRGQVPLLAQVILENIPYGNYDARLPLAVLAHDALNTCPWNEVYDVAEHIYGILKQSGDAERFEKELNVFMHRLGIGWRMIAGHIEARGTDAVEATIQMAAQVLTDGAHSTSEKELREAVQDMSRRPHPDITGAIQHAGAALECIARDVAGSPTKTFGEILKARPDLLPKPLDEAAAKLWGFVSNYGRHVREGRAPTVEEAILVTAISAALVGYIAKHK
jgi:hypothetical protein